jgi:hypothetical protein
MVVQQFGQQDSQRMAHAAHLMLTQAMAMTRPSSLGLTMVTQFQLIFTQLVQAQAPTNFVDRARLEFAL